MAAVEWTTTTRRVLKAEQGLGWRIQVIPVIQQCLARIAELDARLQRLSGF